MRSEVSGKQPVSGLWAIAAGWTGLILATILAYWPGLNGPFVLDDFGALAALGERGGVVDWETFKAFVFGGAAGPTGRPLSLLSFLIDASNWPADSSSFKRTNLAIHLLNGVLLGVLVSQLLAVLQYPKRNARWLALATVAVWLLHPFLVSTTLYVVQRMAQLSTLFILAGLSAYVYGRGFLDTRPRRAFAIMSISVVVFGLLATLSKENGILLPVLIGVLELTVFAANSATSPSSHRLWKIVFLVVPSMIIAVYLGEFVTRDTFFDVVPPRDFSIYERLITQPRVLLEYLQHWFLPKLYTTGVFQDHFVTSAGLLSPPATLLSILLHGAAIAAAFVYRVRLPLFSLAILFFYAGHLLEGSVLNLEMYFEHRNYLPVVFLSLPVLAALRARVSAASFGAVVVTFVLVLGGFTRYSATIWSDFPTMVEASARKAPTSARAQAHYAVNLFNANRANEALHVIDRAIDTSQYPNPLLLVNRLLMLCNTNQLSREEFLGVANTLAPLAYDPRYLRVYTRLAEAVVGQRCTAVSSNDLRGLFMRMLEVPYNADVSSLRYSQIKYFVGYSHAYGGNAVEARQAFEESLSARPGRDACDDDGGRTGAKWSL